MTGQPINICPLRGGAVVKTFIFTPLFNNCDGRQVSYILYYDGRLNSTTECSNGPSCCNRMFKWGRESRCFLRRPLFEDRPWSDENGVHTLSWSYKNSFIWFSKWLRVGHQVKLLNDDGLWKYFVKYLLCFPQLPLPLPIFIKPERSPSNWLYILLWMHESVWTLQK